MDEDVKNLKTWLNARDKDISEFIIERSMVEILIAKLEELDIQCEGWDRENINQSKEIAELKEFHDQSLKDWIVSNKGYEQEIEELRKAICIYAREFSDYDVECENPDDTAIKLFKYQMDQFEF